VLPRLPAYRVYLIYCAAYAFAFWTIVPIVLVYHVEMAGLNPLQLVLVGTALEAAAFLFEVPTGVVADRYSRRLSVIAGVALLGVSYIVEGLFPAFLPILLAQIVKGIGFTFTSGALQAWISDEVGEARAGGAFVRGAQLRQVGALAGIPVGAVLALWGVNVPVIAGGALTTALAVFLLLTMPEDGFHPTPRAERTTWGQLGGTFLDGLRLARGRPLLLLVLGAGLFFGLSSEGFDRLWTPHLIESIGVPPLGPLDPVLWFGVIAFVTSLLGLGLAEVVNRRVDLADGGSLARALAALNLAQVASLAVFALAGSFAVALAAYWVTTAIRRVNEPVYHALLNQRLDSGVRATIFSMSGQLDAAGQMLGGPPVGWLGTAVSLRAALLATAVLLLPAPLLFGWAARRDGRQKTSG
jgi:MFS transporter, DHA3 family, tetracycline resistance protein